MRILRFFLTAFAVIGFAPLSAQKSAVVDPSEKPELFSEADYDALVSCTLENHFDETRRYATYHLNRRDVQTPEQNVADPDSKLLMPAISGCHQLQNGKPMPFSLDRLIDDWAKHHGVADVGGVNTIKDFAACAVRHSPSFAQGYVNTFRSTSERKVRTLSLLVHSMMMPPCVIRGDNVQIDLDELYKLLDKQLRASAGKS